MIDQAEIHQKANSNRLEDRQEAADLFINFFSELPDKVEAYQDLHRLTQDEESNVRETTANVLGIAFSFFPNKELAWNDLDSLIQDDDYDVQYSATKALEQAFPYVPDKLKAWLDLEWLTDRIDYEVRRAAAEAYGSTFVYMPDEDKPYAWSRIVSETERQDDDVRIGALKSMVLAFPHVTDKEKAWQDLHRLTHNEDNDVRMYAYYTLGKASVYRATESEDVNVLQMYLKKAVEYFEKSAHESEYSPARFCHPFYRTYFALTFQGESQGAIQKYLAEAKEAVGGSESRDELLKAVENLAEALQEVQRLKSRSVEDIADNLNAYSWFCNKAADHMVAAEESAPGAVKLMRKCNPLLEEKIQATITDIQKKAKQICQTAHGTGTEYEATGAEMYNAAKDLSAADLVSMQRCSSRIVYQLKKFCKLLPEIEKGLVCEVIEEIGHATDFPDKLKKIELALTYVSPAIERATQIEEETKVIKKDVLARLDDIQLQSGDVAQSLRDLKSTLDELNTIKSNMDQMGQSIEDIGVNQRRLIKKIEKNMPTILGKLEIIARRQQDPRLNKILEELQEMKKSPAEAALDQVVAIISIIGFLLQIMPK